MSDEKRRDWLDAISKLLIPVAIFAVGFVYTYRKDIVDHANQQFERDTRVLQLTASPNERERVLGLKIIEVQMKEGNFSPSMREVVKFFAQGIPSAASTQTAKGIVVDAPQQFAATGTQNISRPASQNVTVFLQIAREDQRAEASALQEKLQNDGFDVQDIELVNHGTIKTYVRYFSTDDLSQASKILESMKKMGFDASEQNFSRLNKDNQLSRQVEVWIGDNQGPLPNR